MKIQFRQYASINEVIAADTDAVAVVADTAAVAGGRADFLRP